MKGKTIKRRRILYWLIAVCGGLVISLVLLEIICRFLPVSQAPLSWPSPLEFQRVPSPICKTIDAGGRTRLKNRETFWPWAVEQQKGPGTFRIIVLGGSAAHGFGYTRGGAFSSLLERLLSERHPDRNIEVINLANVGMSSEQVKVLALHALDELDPDLLLIYSGNNELLDFIAWHGAKGWSGRRIRTMYWMRDHSAFYRTLKNLSLRTLPADIGMTEIPSDYGQIESSAKDWEYALMRYERNLALAGSTAQQRDVAVLLSTVIGNPEVSNRLDRCFFCDSWMGDQPGLGEDWTLDHAFALWDHDRPVEALEMLGVMQGQDADVLRALIFKDLGQTNEAREMATAAANDLTGDGLFRTSPILGARCMVALSILGNQKEIDLIYPWLRDYALSPEFPAWERVYFLCRIGMLAGDADTWRRESERFISSPNYLLTATPKTNTAVEVVAQDLNLPLVRLGEVLAEQTGRDHVGYDLLLDYCHFNHRGAWMAAAAFAQAIEERGWLGAPATDADIWQTASDHAQEPWDMGRDYLLLGDWLGIDDSLASLVHRVPSLEQREERMSALGESGAAAPIQRLWQIHHQAVYNPREALVDQYMELMRSHPELPESGQSSELCARWAAVGP